MLNQRVGFYIRHLRYNLRGGFLIRPLLIAPLFGGLGAVLSAWEEAHPRSVACVGWLLFFISHISRAISVNHIVDRIARETETMSV